jgi:hypothetical protein
MKAIQTLTVLTSTRSKHALVILVALALIAASPIGAAQRLTIRVAPSVALEPATLVVDAVAERDPANRALDIKVESSDYYRNSVMQLDGDQAPRTTTVRYERVPGGNYEVSVTLFGSDGKPRAAASRHIEILSIADR